MLFGLFPNSRSTHPLASARGVRKLIATFDTSDPYWFLKDVNNSLLEMEGLAHVAGTDAAYQATVMLCDCSRGAAATLLGRFLQEGDQYHMSELARVALEKYAGELYHAYSHFIGHHLDGDAKSKRVELVVAAVRAFRAWALEMKLRRFYYRLPLESDWKSANGLLNTLMEKDLDQRAVKAFSDEAAITPRQEYLRGLYGEVVPSNNLLPLQIELLDRFIRSCERLEFNEDHGEFSTHVIDIALAQGPKRIFGDRDDEAATGQKPRFLSTVELHGQLHTLGEQLKSQGEIPQWLRAFPLSMELKESALRLTSQHWLPEPPQRRATRTFDRFEIMVVKGLDQMRAMLAIAERVRAYIVQPHDSSMSQTADTRESSFEMLYRLESELKGVPIETWVQTDHSDTGFAATIKTPLLAYRIGMPIAFRYADGLYWRAGTIRRIGRDPTSRPSIGVEFSETEPADPLPLEAQAKDLLPLSA